ncbi:hypothetical protein [Variovorax sp. J22R115]|uniref:hypothetical protein n=1 Tax=Variovorax sp. J22R115 TaxID=3053509 RepID=UPI002574A53C|nr:hypothetical protein [Variovorax sp. J22R115]MDM0050920.1 hypothetical protein [Variovorax sp. J22R115]
MLSSHLAAQLRRTADQEGIKQTAGSIFSTLLGRLGDALEDAGVGSDEASLASDVVSGMLRSMAGASDAIGGSGDLVGRGGEERAASLVARAANAAEATGTHH